MPRSASSPLRRRMNFPGREDPVQKCDVVEEHKGRVAILAKQHNANRPIANVDQDGGLVR
ncbi:hypothetical protein GCM10011376_19000 [Nocardioides flavus (ex Wang et al. 2016)]|uniref:Uncharacterized protein n=1 Tax=Nocardioides flavus (ex Wang et al. 2016) TaxID=2058780 RepID=A0ABQ3HK36_9ACTN|nr:hypothetical protein GCM10011376_19000 [Nocardioides flavus (ex Wang et al. 2016)]